MSMEEARTKLVCNLSLYDFFRTEIAEGIWYRTNTKVKLYGVVYYECWQMNGNAIRCMRGKERVELIGKGETA